MFKQICILFLLFLIPNFVLAQEKTFIREYTHQVGDADSKITSRSIALNQVKKILLEEIGVYIESTFEMETTETNKEIKELTKNQIVSITAGITETKILDERWNGIEFFIKAEITLDIDEVNKKISQIAKDRNKTRRLEEANERSEQAILELNKIQKKLKETISEKERLKLQLEYANKSDILSASDWFQKGNNADELKEYDNAILYYQKAIELNSDFAAAYFNIALVYHEKGNYDNSIKYYLKTTQLDSSFISAFYNLGLVFDDKGDYEKAIKYYKMALRICPSDEYYNMIGVAYQKLNNIDEAINYYNKSIKFTPNHIAYTNLANCYDDKGSHKEAIVYYKRALELNHESEIISHNLGFSYYERKEYLKANKWFQNTIKLNPSYAITYHYLGDLNSKTGNYLEAIKYYKRAIELNYDEYVISYYNMGLAYQKLGDIDNAVRYIKKAAQLGLNEAQNLLLKSNISY